jgi:hypothetical protein
MDVWLLSLSSDCILASGRRCYTSWELHELWWLQVRAHRHSAVRAGARVIAPGFSHMWRFFMASEILAEQRCRIHGKVFID